MKFCYQVATPDVAIAPSVTSYQGAREKSFQDIAALGYDQAELLARRVGELAGVPVAPALEKIRATGAQSHLQDERERRANVEGAYRPLPQADLAGKRVVLVDDVLTTGATMAQCAACLRSAGAETVVGLTLAWAGQHLDSTSHPE